ncbi:MAG: DUF29 family protein [Microcystaceae cyanobacterium]
MEELLELREFIQSGDLTAALSLIDELEEMSKEDKINKIYSYCIVLLVHIIKQKAEKRTTHSWDVSIRNAVDGIERTNKRRKAGGYYLNQQDLQNLLTEAYPRALDNASLEAYGGIYDNIALGEMIDQSLIIQEALSYLL